MALTDKEKAAYGLLGSQLGGADLTARGTLQDAARTSLGAARGFDPAFASRFFNASALLARFLCFFAYASDAIYPANIKGATISTLPSLLELSVLLLCQHPELHYQEFS